MEQKKESGDEIKERSYLKNLNTAQREAVLTTEGPILVVAGAGAGKTKTITARIAHLIAEGAAAESILAITFTNKAASEMRERTQTLLASAPELNRPITPDATPKISTFHSLSVALLREFHRDAGIPRHFSIYDRDDSKKIIKDALKHIGIDPRSVEPGRILSAISRAKGDGLSPAEYRDTSPEGYFETVVTDVWERYDESLREAHALDFDDLLLRCARLIAKNQRIAEIIQARWKYIHIDEYQDTNKIQYAFIKDIGTHGNIFAVGDMDQTIYTWRGARVRNLLEFQKDFRNVRTILLEENYRSTQTIIAAANDVIRKNTVRIEKTLFTKNPPGELIEVYAAYDEADEAERVAQESAAYIRAGTDPRDIAVLFRANFQSRALEEAFLRADIPYQVLGTRFFERTEVKDTVAYLRLALQPDDRGALARAINVPARGIGKLSLLKILSGKEHELPPKTRASLSSFRSVIAKIKNAAETGNASHAVKVALDASGILGQYQGKGEEDRERKENLEELVSIAARHDMKPGLVGIEDLLTDADLGSEQDELREHISAVRLMTVHAAKGLEFNTVFVTGLEEDLFPHTRPENITSQEESEEERRLFYVAITRAKHRLVLSYASVRTIFGTRSMRMPSQFLLDIDESLLESAQNDAPFPRTNYLSW